MSQSWKDMTHTLRNFLRNPQEVGAIVPSSRFLAQKMIGCIDLKKTSTIVELGAGTGAITNEMIRQANPNQHILIVDLNPESVNLLKERLKNQTNVEVILADARSLETILAKRNIQSVEAIISSLPYASLGTEITQSILMSAARVLSPDGHFVAFQYTSLFRKMFEDHFAIRSSRIELRNLPPAIIYDCVSKTKPLTDADRQKSA